MPVTVKGGLDHLGDIEMRCLEPYLRERLGAKDLEISSIEKFSRGISRETWSIRYTSEHIGNSALILRRDLASRAIVPTSLEFEYEVYRRLAETEVPVPQALFFEADASKLGGRPFYIRAEVEGSWEIEHFADSSPAYIALRLETVKEHLRKLSLVHQVDWQKCGFDRIMDVPADASDCARCAVERSMTALRERQIEPLPILTEAREWLIDNAPPASRVVLLKGTNGIGEEVYRDGKIVAMCDWEQASLGDPASDLARAQDIFVDIFDERGKRLWGMEEGLAYYTNLTGNAVTQEAISYYQTVVALENSVALHNGAVALCEDGEHSVRLAWLATEIAFYGNLQILDAIQMGGSGASDAFLNTQN